MALVKSIPLLGIPAHCIFFIPCCEGLPMVPRWIQVLSLKVDRLLLNLWLWPVTFKKVVTLGGYSGCPR